MLNLFLRLLQIHSLISVSYTHLDVYKRQVCEMIKKHRLRCDPRDSYVEQVVFSAPGVEVRRNDVLSSDSAGLAPTMAMGLSLVPVDGVVGHK